VQLWTHTVRNPTHAFSPASARVHFRTAPARARVPQCPETDPARSTGLGNSRALGLWGRGTRAGTGRLGPANALRPLPVARVLRGFAWDCCWGLFGDRRGPQAGPEVHIVGATVERVCSCGRIRSEILHTPPRPPRRVCSSGRIRSGIVHTPRLRAARVHFRTAPARPPARAPARARVPQCPKRILRARRSSGTAGHSDSGAGARARARDGWGRQTLAARCPWLRVLRGFAWDCCWGLFGDRRGPQAGPEVHIVGATVAHLARGGAVTTV
jgi:hypothetical protein